MAGLVGFPPIILIVSTYWVFFHQHLTWAPSFQTSTALWSRACVGLRTPTRAGVRTRSRACAWASNNSSLCSSRGCITRHAPTRTSLRRWLLLQNLLFFHRFRKFVLHCVSYRVLRNNKLHVAVFCISLFFNMKISGGKCAIKYQLF